MTKCSNCGQEVEEGRNFCPHCGKPLAAGGAASAHAPARPAADSALALQPVEARRERATAERGAAASPPSTMDNFGRAREEEPDGTRRKIYVGVALVAALLVAGIVYLATRPRAPVVEPRLENALRPGAPEFEEARKQVAVEFDPNENAVESPRAAGDIVMIITPTIRNLSNRTVTGVELRATVVDLDDQPVKARTVIPIPARQPELGPYKVMQVPINIEGFQPGDVRANIKVELTGVRFKQ